MSTWRCSDDVRSPQGKSSRGEAQEFCYVGWSWTVTKRGNSPQHSSRPLVCFVRLSEVEWEEWRSVYIGGRRRVRHGVRAVDVGLCKYQALLNPDARLARLRTTLRSRHGYKLGISLCPSVSNCLTSSQNFPCRRDLRRLQLSAGWSQTLYLLRTTPQVWNFPF